MLSNFGSDVLNQLILTADTLGLTSVSPSSITYKAELGTTGNPDTGYTEIWGSSGSTGTVLIGHYSEAMIQASAGAIETSDVLLMCKTGLLASDPTAGDIMEWNSMVYEYANFREAAGLYAIQMKERGAVSEA